MLWLHPERGNESNRSANKTNPKNSKLTYPANTTNKQRKRVKRKKEQVNTKSSGFLSEPQSPEGEFGFAAESSAEGSGLVADQQKILLFNCSELVDFTSGDAILPTRLTCYCRHHNERVGFCVSFFIQDPFGNVLASAISPPIMITDDHKSVKTRGVKRQRTESSPVTLTSQQQPFFLPTSTSSTTPHPNNNTEQDRTMRRYNLPLSPNSPPFSTNDSMTTAHAHAQQSVPRDGFAPNHFPEDPHHAGHKAAPMVFKNEPFDQSFDISDQSYDHMSREEEEEEPGLTKNSSFFSANPHFFLALIPFLFLL